MSLLWIKLNYLIIDHFVNVEFAKSSVSIMQSYLSFVSSDELRERHQGAERGVQVEAAGGAHPARGRGEAA